MFFIKMGHSSKTGFLVSPLETLQWLYEYRISIVIDSINNISHQFSPDWRIYNHSMYSIRISEYVCNIVLMSIGLMPLVDY